ncbi:hypothetical protein QFC22_004198 [Naganishia vaughanmartiniae]|uniref:Uncharacterized protein n=1 Tax=Naganishia vaughanmartiniae TaxID=1424756 RepID=A0ACC2X4R8_9TREE|nr:hypothetical protein QFC22_004198 [Naganishia vaughanmartiniae]
MQIVLASLGRNPSILPTAVIASQTLFFGVQAIAAWKQLKFMDTSAYKPPIGPGLSSEDAKVYPLRIRQSLVAHLLERAAWCGVTIAQSLGGWNVMWNVALSAGRWFERTFGSNNGHLVANPVFFVLDYVVSLAASLMVRNLYLTYNAPRIHPETASLSFFVRLKRRVSRPWNSNTRKMWFYKTFVPYLLPLISIVPGIVAATSVQYRLERSSSVSFRRICWESFKVATLNMTLIGIMGASIPYLFFEPEKPVVKEDAEDLPSWAVEQCAISDLQKRGVQLKGVNSGTTIELTEVEYMVKSVAKDTAYNEEVNISMRLDTELSGKDERALGFMPRLFLGTLTLSQQQFALFTDGEMKALIAIAFLPEYQFPLNIKKYILMFLTAALPLLMDPLMYCLFRKAPQMFNELVPSLKSTNSIVPLSVSLVVSQALTPWIVYPMKLLLRRIKELTYGDDALIASLSSDYAKGWSGVLSKHTVLNVTQKGEEENVQDYGKVDSFFEYWFASYGKDTVQPPLLQRLERIQQFER